MPSGKKRKGHKQMAPHPTYKTKKRTNSTQSKSKEGKCKDGNINQHK